LGDDPAALRRWRVEDTVADALDENIRGCGGDEFEEFLVGALAVLGDGKARWRRLRQDCAVVKFFRVESLEGHAYVFFLGKENMMERGGTVEASRSVRLSMGNERYILGEHWWMDIDSSILGALEDARWDEKAERNSYNEIDALSIWIR
jgi:hypothetical protein